MTNEQFIEKYGDVAMEYMLHVEDLACFCGKEPSGQLILVNTTDEVFEQFTGGYATVNQLAPYVRKTDMV